MKLFLWTPVSLSKHYFCILKACLLFQTQNPDFESSLHQEKAGKVNGMLQSMEHKKDIAEMSVIPPEDVTPGKRIIKKQISRHAD